MYKPRLIAAALFAAAVLLFLTPRESQAQRFGRGYYGGYPGYYPGSYSYPGYYNYGWNYGSGRNYGYPNYSYPGSYGWSYYPSSAYYTSPRYVAMPQSGEYQSFYYAPESNGYQDQQDRRARVEVIVPPDAEVWFDDHKTQQTGSNRLFVSGPLQANANYSYDIRARWLANGQPVERTRHVNVQPGQQIRVDFMRDPNNGRPATGAEEQREPPAPLNNEREQPRNPANGNQGTTPVPPRG